jgi:DNA-binding NarL/FixJ family response regulator
MTNVLLIDDHRLFSASLSVALRAHGFAVDTPALTSRAEVAGHLVETRPDIAIIDLDLGALGNGKPLITVAVDARVHAVVVSAGLDDVAAGHCYALGAAACVPKSEPLDELLATIAAVAGGSETVLETERYRLISVWRRWQAEADTAAGSFAHLTARESSVLSQLMGGQSVKSIAADNLVSEATVRTQVHAILTKLGASSQLEAVAMAIRAGWPGSTNVLA